MPFVRLVLGVACLGVLALLPTSGAAEKSKALPAAWGKPVNGLQAGIRVKPSDPLPGSILELEVVIRNVGQKKVRY